MTDDDHLTHAVAALREVILAGEHYRIKAASYLGLSLSESQAVSYLFARGPMGPTDLAEALGFNTSSTTALIDRLQRQGLVERRPDPHDRRRINVLLSETGEVALADVRAWMTTALRDIPPSALPELTTHLGLLAEALHALPDGPTTSGHGERSAAEQ